MTAIFLVEDNRSDEKLALAAFKACGIPNEIVVARDGAEAIEKLFGMDPLPALVLLDLKLPKLDGHEVLERIRANPRTKHVPVIVMSASTQPEDIRRSYELGANAYIRKPIELDEFRQSAKALAAFWLGVNVSTVRG